MVGVLLLANDSICCNSKKNCFHFILSGLKYLLYVVLHSHMRLGDMSGVTAIGRGDTEAGNIMPVQ